MHGTSDQWTERYGSNEDIHISHVIPEDPRKEQASLAARCAGFPSLHSSEEKGEVRTAEPKDPSKKDSFDDQFDLLPLSCAPRSSHRINSSGWGSARDATRVRFSFHALPVLFERLPARHPRHDACCLFVPSFRIPAPRGIGGTFEDRIVKERHSEAYLLIETPPASRQ